MDSNGHQAVTSTRPKSLHPGGSAERVSEHTGPETDPVRPPVIMALLWPQDPPQELLQIVLLRTVGPKYTVNDYPGLLAPYNVVRNFYLSEDTHEYAAQKAALEPLQRAQANVFLELAQQQMMMIKTLSSLAQAQQAQALPSSPPRPQQQAQDVIDLTDTDDAPATTNVPASRTRPSTLQQAPPHPHHHAYNSTQPDQAGRAVMPAPGAVLAAPLRAVGAVPAAAAGRQRVPVLPAQTPADAAAFVEGQNAGQQQPAQWAQGHKGMPAQVANVLPDGAGHAQPGQLRQAGVHMMQPQQSGMMRQAAAAQPAPRGMQPAHAGMPMLQNGAQPQPGMLSGLSLRNLAEMASIATSNAHRDMVQARARYYALHDECKHKLRNGGAQHGYAGQTEVEKARNTWFVCKKRHEEFQTEEARLQALMDAEVRLAQGAPALFRAVPPGMQQPAVAAELPGRERPPRQRPAQPRARRQQNAGPAMQPGIAQGLPGQVDAAPQARAGAKRTRADMPGSDGFDLESVLDKALAEVQALPDVPGVQGSSEQAGLSNTNAANKRQRHGPQPQQQHANPVHMPGGNQQVMAQPIRLVSMAQQASGPVRTPSTGQAPSPPLPAPELANNSPTHTHGAAKPTGNAPSPPSDEDMQFTYQAVQPMQPMQLVPMQPAAMQGPSLQPMQHMQPTLINNSMPQLDFGLDWLSVQNAFGDDDDMPIIGA